MSSIKNSSTMQSSNDSVFSNLSGASAFIAQDLGLVKTTLDGANVSAGKFASSLTGAFTNASSSARSFQGVLSTVLNSMGQSLVTTGVSKLTNSLPGLIGSLVGGVGGGISAFADGGIVASPTYFGTGAGAGLMGERGAEAIMPLARGPNGQLGVVAQGGARVAPIHVTIQTNDVESFRRSQSQIAGALARAVARGQRST